MRVAARIVVLAGAIAAIPGSGVAAPGSAGAGEPEALIRKTVDDAFVVLKTKALAGKDRRGERIAELRRIADRVFDWSEMARSSLGVRWRALDAGQRGRFVEVFKGILAAEYLDDIDRFQGTETVTVDGAVQQGEEVLVRSTLVTSSHDRVPIDYRMRSAQGKWMVVDLSIEGVSLVNHFRKTFANALANMSIDDLIVRLTRQLPPAAKPGGS